MRIGIVAPAELQRFWEQHIRTFQSVKEVEMVNRTEALTNVDACLFAPKSSDPVEEALQVLKHSIHLFWILPLPESVFTANRFVAVSEESGASVQFVCWPVHHPATLRMMQHIPRPEMIDIRRDIPYSDCIKSGLTHDQLYRDEIAYCSFWINHALYDLRYSANPDTTHLPAFTDLELQFVNGARSSIRIDTTADSHNYQRIASNKNMTLRHDIESNAIIRAESGNQEELHLNREQLPEHSSARQALSSFFRSISHPTFRNFNSYELKRFCSIIEALERKRER